MIQNKKVVVIMPAYNAELTLKKTFDAIPRPLVDEIILTDDGSSDRTVQLSRELGITTFIHPANKGYGANQKTCYREALKAGADIIVMLHPDYQYNPRLITAMSSLIAEGIYDMVIGSRILGTSALKGGMPLYKYVANRVLTLAENLLTGNKLSEYHSGYRAFARRIFDVVPARDNSDDFLFDNQLLLQILHFKFSVAEISCPTLYNQESSSINFWRSVRYGFGVLGMGMLYFLARTGIYRSRFFNPDHKKISDD